MTTQVEPGTVHAEVELPHPPAKVWRALTDPELVAAWLMKNDLKPVVGRAFTFRMEPTQWWDGIVQCKVLESTPHERLQYSWASGAGPNAIDTIVTFTLTPTASGGTRLSVEQTGFAAANKFAFDGARQGWAHMIGSKIGEVLAGLA